MTHPFLQNLQYLTHGEEVHGRNDFAVIAQESRPALAGVVGRRQAPEIAGRCVRRRRSRVKDLTVNPRSTPRGIFAHHPSDECSNLGTCPGSLAGTEDAKTNESQPDATQQQFLV